MRSGADPTPAEIERVVRSHLNVSKHVNEKSGMHSIADCFLCGKPKHLYVNMETGAWDCKVCGESGGFWKLADAIGVRVRSATMVRSPMSVMLASRANTSGAATKAAQKPLADGPKLSMEKVNVACEHIFGTSDDGAKVLAYLRTRAFTDDTIRRFKLGMSRIAEKNDAGVWETEIAVGIPYLEDGKVPMLKMRNINNASPLPRFMRSKGADSRLFNADAVKEVRRAVLVEGEFDAISLHQAGITTVASTSLGGKKSIPADWLLALEGIEEIVLWYDADGVGNDAVQGLVHELGTWRVKIAAIDEQTSQAAQKKLGKKPKDVNDLLVAGISHECIRGIVDAALPIDNAMIVTADRYADPLYALVDRAEESLGTPFDLPVMNNTLRGSRSPELIIVTGHTGHGKSSFIQDRLEFSAENGEPIFITKLEDGPIACARNIFQRRYGGPISTIRNDADKASAYDVIATLNKHPIHILDVYGRIEMATLVDACTYARRRYGCRKMMIDHLGYILPRDQRRDEREAMDSTLMELVELTRRIDATIYLICHPRGSTEQSKVPTGDDVRGTSQAKQLADSGISVWRDISRQGDSIVRKLSLKDEVGRRFDVEMSGTEALFYAWKTRHPEATTGHGVLAFSRKTLRYAPRPDATAQEPDPRLPREDGPQQSLSIDPFADIPFSDGEGNK